MYNKKRKIHFVGIGGSGMSGIAELLINMGYTVSGSDIIKSDTTARLSKLGAKIFKKHAGVNIEGAEVVVISSAVSMKNIEVIAAKKSLIPVIQRAEMLAELMRLKYGIAVAGSHGKTTTTSLIGSVLSVGGNDPTVVTGGKLKGIGSGAKLGKGDFLIAEADESDGSFLRLSPSIAIITNIDSEHLDYYGDLDKIKNTFLKFINHLPFYGSSILCNDHENVREIIYRYEKRYVTYGITREADFTADNISHKGIHTSFTALHNGKPLGNIKIELAGKHNVSNSLAAIAVGFELDIPFERIKKGLEDFKGIHRRFQLIGKSKGVQLIDDYGHHPTEIIATLRAARDAYPDKKIITLFQPHRYSRTRDLLEEFSDVFIDSNHIIITSIYAAGEKPINGVTGETLYKKINKKSSQKIEYIEKKDKILSRLKEISRPGDIVITMGAGDIWKIGEKFLLN